MVFMASPSSSEATSSRSSSPSPKQKGSCAEENWMGKDSFALHKGLEAIASSLSLLSETLGTAIEDGLSLVEKKANNLMYTETPPRRRRYSNASEARGPSPAKSVTPSPKPKASTEGKNSLPKDDQLKASRDVAMAMATKAKLLLRELKGVRTDLTFSRNRCAQVEEENRRLRESIEKGIRHEEDDLVRLQLETLLAEKARLTQENAEFARENKILHEVVQYHQLKFRDMAISDEDMIMEDEDMVVDEDGRSLDDDAYVGVDAVDRLPLYPREEDIIALEESMVGRSKKPFLGAL